MRIEWRQNLFRHHSSCSWRKSIGKRSRLASTYSGSRTCSNRRHCNHFVHEWHNRLDFNKSLVNLSGCLGLPKGAMLTHGNLTSNSEVLADIWRFSKDDVLLHLLPFYHIHGERSFIKGRRLYFRSDCLHGSHFVQQIDANLPSQIWFAWRFGLDAKILSFYWCSDILHVSSSMLN